MVVEKNFEDFISYNPSLVNSPRKSLSYFRFWNLYLESNDLRNSIEGAFHVGIISRVLLKLKMEFAKLLRIN